MNHLHHIEQEVQWTEYTSCKVSVEVQRMKYESREYTSTCVLSYEKCLL